MDHQKTNHSCVVQYRSRVHGHNGGLPGGTLVATNPSRATIATRTSTHNHQHGQLWGGQLLATNAVYHSRTKHIDVRHHFVREQVEARTIKLEHVPSAEMKAESLTETDQGWLVNSRSCPHKGRIGIQVYHEYNAIM